MRRLHEVRRRAAAERGFTLVEMLTVMAILGTVLGSLTAVFVSALRAEVDMNQRFEAQQNARLALGKLRREIHCARDATVPTPDTLSLTYPASLATATGYCRAVDSTWCVRPLGASRFGLYRAVGATCDAGSGLLVADFLTSADVFTFVHPPESRAKVRVDLRVDRDPSDGGRAYRLFDEITLRGSGRA